MQEKDRQTSQERKTKQEKKRQPELTSLTYRVEEGTDQTDSWKSKKRQSETASKKE